MKANVVKISLILLMIFTVSCTRDLSPNTYNTEEVGAASKVEPGIVVDKRVVKIDNNSGAGGVTGVVGGAAAGSAVGGGTRMNVLGAVGGAIIGGLVGNAIDKGINQQQGYEYILKLKTGKSISVVQAMNVDLAIGQHVLVIYGKMTRVIPDQISQRV